MGVVASFVLPHPPLIIPDVGKGDEQKVNLTIESYLSVAKEIKEIKPDTIIISSPHAPFYSDGFWMYSNKSIYGDLKEFNAQNVSFLEEIDLDLVQEIDRIAKIEDFPVSCSSFVERLDHAAIVPLYFIRKFYPKCKIVIVGLSFLPLIDHYKFGMIINQALDNLGTKAVFIASGDMSHKLRDYGPYGLSKEGIKYEKQITEDLASAMFNNLLEYDEAFLEKAAECGHRSFTIMGGLWDGYNVIARFFSHEEVTGVGYGVYSFRRSCSNEKNNFYSSFYAKHIAPMPKTEIALLARQAIDYYLKKGLVMSLPEMLSDYIKYNKAGVFVSIKKFGVLRGCIGTTSPVHESIADEIIHNAISAAFDDPRFSPIKPEEFPYLNISVDVLSEAEEITSLDELNPKVYGVIVYNDSCSGLLLPDLEGIDDCYMQINIAKEKAGIIDDNYRIKRFTVTRYY